MMPLVLEHPQAQVRIEQGSGGRWKVAVACRPGAHPPPVASCVTDYPVDLIATVLRVQGPSHLCDEIRRDEDRGYVAAKLEHGLLSYLGRETFEGAVILDFGCGSGASTLHLGRLFPRSLILGVELRPELLEAARARADWHGLGNVRFIRSPGPAGVPRAVGKVDFIVMNAVYEHLLPAARRTLVPRLWSRLVPGGVLFVNETPHRFWPVDHHTTGLPLVNYLPDRLAHACALRFSPRLRGDETWEGLLRRGIRGGTAGEILGIIRRRGMGAPELLSPTRPGLHDAVDLWYDSASASGRLRRLARAGLKALHRLSGLTLVPSLTLAIRKLEYTLLSQRTFLSEAAPWAHDEPRL